MIQGIAGEEKVNFKHLTVHIAFLLSPSPLKLKHRKYHACASILIQQSTCLNVSACPFVKCIGDCNTEVLCVKSCLHELGEKNSLIFSEAGGLTIPTKWCEFQYTILLFAYVHLKFRSVYVKNG